MPVNYDVWIWQKYGNYAAKLLNLRQLLNIFLSLGPCIHLANPYSSLLLIIAYIQVRKSWDIRYPIILIYLNYIQKTLKTKMNWINFSRMKKYLTQLFKNYK